MAKSPPAAPTVDSLLDKGDGVLVKTGGVWSYPGAPLDPAGTNVVVPAESVPHGAVLDALSKGDLVAKSSDLMGAPTSVTRKPDEGVVVRSINSVQAGSVDACTELPPGSRPTHDAGRRDGRYAYVESPVADASKSASASPAVVGVNGPSIAPASAAGPAANAPGPAAASNTK